MTTAKSSGGGRQPGLNRGRIVDAAIELLDAGGERELTFRALALRLETGHGAIQWHLANKGELLIAATVGALTPALHAPAPGTPPRLAVRAVALAVFDAIDAHPWLGAQLFALPWQPAMVQLWERIGRPLEALGVPERSLFTAVSTLLGYIVGVGSQNATNGRIAAGDAGRDEFLESVAERWEGLDAANYPFVTRVARQLRAHDDREEFLAGLDIILDGLPKADGSRSLT